MNFNLLASIKKRKNLLYFPSSLNILQKLRAYLNVFHLATLISLSIEGWFQDKCRCAIALARKKHHQTKFTQVDGAKQ